MPEWVNVAYKEYAKRLPKELNPQLKEIQPGLRTKTSSVEQVIKAEGESILAALPPKNKKVILEVKGKAWTTEVLAENLSSWMMDGQDVSFVIGGPNGLSKDCLSQADQLWSLSNLTLPHPLVRIVFIEQLYRAWSILQNHPYHK